MTQNELIDRSSVPETADSGPEAVNQDAEVALARPLDPLFLEAAAFARAAKAPATLRAYAADRPHFVAWCLAADAHVNAARATNNYGSLSDLYAGNGNTCRDCTDPVQPFLVERSASRRRGMLYTTVLLSSEMSPRSPAPIGKKRQ